MMGYRAVDLDCLDQASALVAQIHAMALMTYGSTGDGFRAQSEEIQDNFMWAMESKIEEMKNLISSMVTSSSGGAA
jgi:hypothetical protein